jgi:hypothetical protein
MRIGIALVMSLGSVALADGVDCPGNIAVELRQKDWGTLGWELDGASGKVALDAAKIAGKDLVCAYKGDVALKAPIAKVLPSCGKATATKVGFVCAEQANAVNSTAASRTGDAGRVKASAAEETRSR